MYNRKTATFTYGHEHLWDFGLINMNGRMYQKLCLLGFKRFGHYFLFIAGNVIKIRQIAPI